MGFVEGCNDSHPGDYGVGGGRLVACARGSDGAGGDALAWVAVDDILDRSRRNARGPEKVFGGTNCFVRLVRGGTRVIALKAPAAHPLTSIRR